MGRRRTRVVRHGLSPRVGFDKFREVPRRRIRKAAFSQTSWNESAISRAVGDVGPETPGARPLTSSYDQVVRFGAYLQQQDMESNGKSVNLEESRSLRIGTLIGASPAHGSTTRSANHRARYPMRFTHRRQSHEVCPRTRQARPNGLAQPKRSDAGKTKTMFRRTDKQGLSKTRSRRLRSTNLPGNRPRNRDSPSSRRQSSAARRLTRQGSSRAPRNVNTISGAVEFGKQPARHCAQSEGAPR